METRNPDHAAAVEALFQRAPFADDIGLGLEAFGPGWCETALEVAPRHLQQDGWIHAGVQATVADHTAGAAGISLVAADQTVVSAEININLLRAAKGRRLRCRARVLRAGRRLVVVESEVLSEQPAEPVLTAKATIILAVVARPGAHEGA